MRTTRWTKAGDDLGLVLRRSDGERVVVLVDWDRQVAELIDAAGPWRLRRDGVVVSRGGVTLRRLVRGVTDPRLVVRQADPLDCRRASLQVVSRAEVALDGHRRRRA